MSVPGDSARWTVDDATLVLHSPRRPGHPNVLYFTIPFLNQITRHEYDALVADIRAARVHEGCTQATDTLRQARELAAAIRNAPYPGSGNFERREALVDLLLTEGPDHE